MFVIADQCAARIDRQSSLARSRQPKEDCRFAIGADVGRTMHRHDAFDGKLVVQDPEDGFFHFSSVFRTANQDEFFGQVDGDHRFRICTVTLRVCTEAREIDNRIFGRKTGQFFFLRTAQKRPDKQIMPGQFVDHPDPYAMRGLGSAIKILHEQSVPSSGLTQEILFQSGKMIG